MKLQPGKTQRTARQVFNRATRFVWIRLPWHQVSVSVPWNKNGTFQHVMLSLTRGTNQSVTIDLTSLTLPELLAFREAVLIATEVAEPLVKTRDAEARDRLENDGDDSDDRIYRGLPTVVIRKGALGQYDQGILQRREAVLQGIGTQLLPGGLPPVLGGTVDELEQDVTESDDKSASDGEPA